MKNVPSLEKLEKCFQAVKDAVAALDREMQFYRAEPEYDAQGLKLRDLDVYIMQQIGSQSDPVFQSDLVTADDVCSALVRVNPSLEGQVTPVRVGKSMARTGRYMRLRATKGRESHRIWCLRNFHVYRDLTSATLYKTYEQLQAAVPPDYRPAVQPSPMTIPELTTDDGDVKSGVDLGGDVSFL